MAMGASFSTREFRRGDKVVHDTRPEWGIGEVLDAKSQKQGGKEAQSLSIRFERAGLKTISTAFATLSPAEGDRAPMAATEAKADDDNWLETLTAEDAASRLASIPERASDPFSSLGARLTATLDLYRFSDQGGSLLDWAAAQSGLNDPLTRFNRHELEQHFASFQKALGEHLKSLLQQMRKAEPAEMERIVRASNPAAQRAVRDIDARR